MHYSYEQEVIRKRRAARIFWFLVFSFAVFLYFFFQGYYPSVNFSLKEYLANGELRRPEREDLVRSFGIVNIRVEPRDARILLSGDEFGNDEKKMVAYGKYRLSIGKPGYVQDWVDFTINRDIPYYIDEVTLLPRATYSRIGTGNISVSKLDEEAWLFQTANKSYLMDETLSGSEILPKDGYHIGEGVYLSGFAMREYRSGNWERRTWSGANALIRECDATLSVKEGYLSCPKTAKAISIGGKLYTSVQEIGRGYIETASGLTHDKGIISLTDGEKGASFFIEKDDTWYIPSGGNFIPLTNQTGMTSIPLITTPLDTISYADWIDGSLAVFGKKGVDTFIVFIKDEKIGPLIPFPDIPLVEVRLAKYEGNIFFKTKNALLFLYNNSKRVEWITEGEILAYSPVAAIYKKDGEVWRASWVR